MGTRIIGKGLLLDCEGATEKEKQRGIEAAWSVFDRAGVSAVAAAYARFKRDAGDEGGFQGPNRPTEEEAEIDHLWDEAEAAAIDACCATWAKRPNDASLELHYDAVDDKKPLLRLVSG